MEVIPSDNTMNSLAMDFIKLVGLYIFLPSLAVAVILKLLKIRGRLWAFWLGRRDLLVYIF